MKKLIEIFKNIFIIVTVLVFFFLSVGTLTFWMGVFIGAVANQANSVIPAFSISLLYAILFFSELVLGFYSEQEKLLGIKGQRILCITNILWLFLFLGFPFIYQNVPVIRSICWCVEYYLFSWMYIPI
ncbi:MAG: hypothetical protein IJE45_01430 [Bacilli bacterium]|nr:hypothetical protein [Bacilli bacterium]